MMILAADQVLAQAAEDEAKEPIPR